MADLTPAQEKALETLRWKRRALLAVDAAAMALILAVSNGRVAFSNNDMTVFLLAGGVALFYGLNEWLNVSLCPGCRMLFFLHVTEKATGSGWRAPFAKSCKNCGLSL